MMEGAFCDLQVSSNFWLSMYLASCYYGYVMRLMRGYTTRLPSIRAPTSNSSCIG